MPKKLSKGGRAWKKKGAFIGPLPRPKPKAFIGPLPRPKFIGPLPRPKRPKEIHFSAPKAVGYQRTTTAPRINKGNMFEITHSEYLQPVVTDNKFSITTYNLQFASIDNFPWAGPVCQNWDQFQIVKCKFRFETRCGTDQKGRLIVATQKNVEEADFTADYEMLAYNGAKDGSLWKKMVHNSAIRLSAPLKKYYTLTDGTTAPGDPTAYTPGKMSFSCYSSDTPGTVVMDLFVDYTVRLFNAKQQPAISMVQGLQAYSVGANTSNPVLGLNNPLYRFNSFTQSVMPIFRAGSSAGELVSEFKQVGAYYVGLLGNAEWSTGAGESSNMCELIGIDGCTPYELELTTDYPVDHVTDTLISLVTFVATAAATLTFTYEHVSAFKGCTTSFGIWPIPLNSATFLEAQAPARNGHWVVSAKDEYSPWFIKFCKERKVDGYKVLVPGQKPIYRGTLALRMRQRERKEEKVEELQPGLDHESDEENTVNLDGMMRTMSADERRQWAEKLLLYDQPEGGRPPQLDPEKQKKLDFKIQEQEKRHKSPAK
jgi:hypothetical protein